MSEEETSERAVLLRHEMMACMTRTYQALVELGEQICGPDPVHHYAFVTALTTFHRLILQGLPAHIQDSIAKASLHLEAMAHGLHERGEKVHGNDE